jgi:beta-glucosidase
LSEKVIDSFARYTEKVSMHMGDLFAGVCTFNEPNIARLLRYILPFSPKDTPFWENAANYFEVTPDMLGLYQFVSEDRMWDIIHKAHEKATSILKSGKGDFPVGLTVAMTDVHSVEGGEENAIALRKDISDRYLERLNGDDFVGVQTYSRFVVGAEGLIKPGPDTEVTQMHEEFYPAAIGGTIRLASKVAGIPIIVTENGVATEDDSRRIEYYKKALTSVAECLQEGIDVKGYYCWSAFDNFEWVGGYEPKFGIIGVDRETLNRNPKESAYYLGKIAQTNSVVLG